MQTSNIETGQLGEDIAAGFLANKGYSIVERNWRCKHWEVDIIAFKHKKLHFIEVKTRSSMRFGKPEESITREKMTHLKNAAEAYQYQHPEWKYLQFDVIAITLVNGITKEIYLIEDVYF
ncbi:MAG: YraN family protein [Bacteroidota bacterium]